MKAFLLAAGNGERLRPLTNQIAKCLVPIQGVPLLSIWLELCRRHGIDEVLVNTHAHADGVRNHLKHHSDGIRVHLVKEETLLGSAGTLAANRQWVQSEPEFWIFYADVLTNMNLTRMLASHRAARRVATMGVYTATNPRDCGIVTIDRYHTVQAFVEKPSRPASNLAFSGILLATPSILDEIPPRVPADLGFHVFPRLIGRMAAHMISEYLLDVGTPRAYSAAQLDWPGLGALSPRKSSC
jgi:mannose-1-phosphate guanylyltransferase